MRWNVGVGVGVVKLICLEQGADCLHNLYGPADATVSQNPIISCPM